MVSLYYGSNSGILSFRSRMEARRGRRRHNPAPETWLTLAERKRTVSTVALRDSTWPSTLVTQRRADPVRTIIDHHTRPASLDSRGDPNRRAIQREQTPSVATEGVCSKLMWELAKAVR